VTDIIGQYFGGLFMKPQRYRTVQKRIHPPEADRIADTYRQAKSEIAQCRERFLKVLQGMDIEWEGNQKDHFADHARQEELKISNYYSYLGEVERRFRNIEVVVEVQEPIPFS
jgi:uncharacterized protein YukE